jgi:16S rRNA (guanine527-N7)-methyltransferase
LVEVVREAARLGFLGPGPVEAHLDHAARFVEALRPAASVLDLGSGGGLPGLAIAARRPEVHVVLLDASVTRTDFLRRAIGRLGWSGRVTVVTARAEDAGREPQWRGTLDAVVARGFGEPVTTAECAAPFLRVGGQLVVSEPPDPVAGRWPEAGLALVGLLRDGWAAGSVATFTQLSLCPDRFPRRRHRPPLFHVERA